MDLWKDLPPSDSAIPDFPTRISLARLLMEVGMEEAAVEVVERLVGEDDQSVEAWYLGGWGLYLLGQKRQERLMTDDAVDYKADERVEGEDISTTSLISSREWLRQSLSLYGTLEYEDDRLRDHAMELVAELDEALKDRVVDGMEHGGDAVEGDDKSEEEEDEDEEMAGT